MDLSAGIARLTDGSDAPGPAQGLFNSAYEHPKETALMATSAVATVALAGSTVYLTRGRILAGGLKVGAETLEEKATSAISAVRADQLGGLSQATQYLKREITQFVPHPPAALSESVRDIIANYPDLHLKPVPPFRIGTDGGIGSGISGGKGFKFDGSPESRVWALQKLKRAVNYSKLVPKDSKVLLFGETHPVSESRDELIENLDTFKQMKFTHLAMEALTKKRQPLLDAYFSGSHPNATAKAISKVLNKDWGWDTPSYAKLIEEAKEKGIRVLATDKIVPKALRETWDKAGLYTENSRVREKQWADVITDQVKRDPNSRVLMLVGKGHVGIDPEHTRWLTTLLDRNKLKPAVIELEAPTHSIGEDNLYQSAVKAAGLEDERFVVPVAQHGTFRSSDFIVNLPARPGSSTYSDPFKNLWQLLSEMKGKWSAKEF